jgi:2-amino-4-hydroxy-6-hydroxymethyldihydropteridine diphosphokinase
MIAAWPARHSTIKGIYCSLESNPYNGLMVTAYIALGSNLGDRQAHLRRALGAVALLPGVELVTVSRFIETEPVGPQDQGLFLNAAAKLETSLEPGVLLSALLDIERRLGRPAREDRRHWGPREIDLDLLLYGDRVLDQPGLTVPHPHLHERAFVLEPLCEVASDVTHPVLNLTVGALWEMQRSRSAPLCVAAKAKFDVAGGLK